MPKPNSDSPWNPAKSTDISPEEYEQQVVAWLREAGGTLDHFEVEHLTKLSGTGGDYEFDAIVKFTILNGAQIVVLVECKRYSRPVEREKLLSLCAKMQDVNAHKAVMFATSGFQSGALKYAKAYNIATIALAEGSFLYVTKSIGPSKPPPNWTGLPKFVGILMCDEEGRISCSTIDFEHIEALSDWLNK